MANEEEQDPQIERIPEAGKVETETLLIEAYNLIKYVPDTPEPEYDLERRDFQGSLRKHGEEQSQENGI